MRPFSAPWSSRSSQPPAPVTSSTWWALTVVDRTTLSLTTIQFSTHVTLVSTFIREIQLNMKLPGYWRKSSCRFDTVYDLKSRKEKPHYSLFSGHVVKYNYRQPALMPRYEPPSGEFFFSESLSWKFSIKKHKKALPILQSDSRPVAHSVMILMDFSASTTEKAATPTFALTPRSSQEKILLFIHSFHW